MDKEMEIFVEDAKHFCSLAEESDNVCGDETINVYA